MNSQIRILTRGATWIRSLLLVGPALLVPDLASATTVTTHASPFTGDPLSVTVSIDDAASPGDLVITLSVDPGFQADLRGFFSQISDERLLAGLSVAGPNVTGSVFSANAVIDLGQGANLQGEGTPCPCDLGIEIGAPGIGHGDDFHAVTFTLSHATANLTVDLLAGQYIGVRATSVGGDSGDREGSSKLVAVVPEPSSAILSLLGLAGLALIRPSKVV